MRDDPLKIASAIELSEKTYKNHQTEQDLGFILQAAIPLAMPDFVNPMIAALSMAFSDITVVDNTLRF